MRKKDILIIIGGIIVLVLVILIASINLGTKKPGSVEVTIDKGEYQTGDALRVKIENNLKGNICFSSCYPYYIQKQKKNGDWENYRYVDCPKENIAEKCVDPKQIKAFELTLPKVEEGFHRLAVSACLGCRFNEEFKEDQKFYSNNFIVK